MADDDDAYAYLAGLSEHPNRQGDTANLNPAFAQRLAAAIRQARGEGLPIGVMSAFREPGQTGSAYDAGGNSAHSYGLASDVSGLDGPNGKITTRWGQIAAENGLNNPYGVGNAKEFNHWQLPPQPLEQTPQLLASLKQAKASGSWPAVWSAYSGGGDSGAAPIRTAAAPINPGLTVNSSPLAGSHSQFIQDYARSIGLNPNLALGIAGAEGLKSWSAKNPNAASGVDIDPNGQPFSFGDFQLNIQPGAMGAKAIAAGIDPRDPAQWQAADKFALDQMKAGGVGPWKGDAVAAAYLKSGAIPDATTATGPIDPSIIARGGTSPPIPGASPVAGALATSSGVLPGFGTKQASDDFLAGLKKAGITPDTGQGGGEQQPDMRPSPIMQGPGARNASSPQSIGMQASQLEPQLTGYSPSLYGQSLNSQPLSWGSAPIGAPSWLKAGPQAQGGGYGTSLNSLQMAGGLSPQQLQMLMNPMMLDQGGGYG